MFALLPKKPGMKRDVQYERLLDVERTNDSVLDSL